MFTWYTSILLYNTNNLHKKQDVEIIIDNSIIENVFVNIMCIVGYLFNRSKQSFSCFPLVLDA